jgi:hypothetical protein
MIQSTRSRRFALALPFLAGVASLVAACSSSSGTGGTGGNADGGSCTGTAPNCFGNDVQGCCGQDPAGQATCQSGQWMCGSAVAPGCNGKSCLSQLDSGGAMDSQSQDGSSGCTGQAPNCFGNNQQQCCGQDPAGPATCVGSNWMCGAAGAPGCNGTNCLLQGDGSGNDGSATCIGQAPNCFGNDIQTCCGQDPSGVATCQGGMWMCGSAAAPGCDGTSCLNGGG